MNIWKLAAFPTAKEKVIVKVGLNITPNSWHTYIYTVTFYVYVISQGLE